MTQLIPNVPPPQPAPQPAPQQPQGPTVVVQPQMPSPQQVGAYVQAAETFARHAEGWPMTVGFYVMLAMIAGIFAWVVFKFFPTWKTEGEANRQHKEKENDRFQATLLAALKERGDQAQRDVEAERRLAQAQSDNISREIGGRVDRLGDKVDDVSEDVDELKGEMKSMGGVLRSVASKLGVGLGAVAALFAGRVGWSMAVLVAAFAGMLSAGEFAAALEGPRRLVSPSTSSSFFGRVLDSVRSALRPRASFDCSSAGRCSPPEYCCAPEYCCSNGTCCRRSVDVPTPEAAPVPHSLVGLGADGYDASPDPFARHDYDVAAAWM